MTSVHGDFAPSELVLIRASDREALAALVVSVSNFLEQAPSALLKDVAYTCSKTKGQSTLAVVTQSVEDLRARLSLAASRMAAGAKRIKDKSGTYYETEPVEGKLAFLAPGGFSFYPDMMCDLAIFFPECRGAFDELEEALSGIGAFSPASFVFPPASYYRRDADVFSAGGYAESLVSVYSGDTVYNSVGNVVGQRRCISAKTIILLRPAYPPAVERLHFGNILKLIRQIAMRHASAISDSRKQGIFPAYQIICSFNSGIVVAFPHTGHKSVSYIRGHKTVIHRPQIL